MSPQQQRAPRMEDSLPRIFGRYLLVERLSRGGMGEIFLARHGMSGFEKLVVIKKVLPHFAADREFLTRFIDEAQVAVHLQHANIAQVYEVGRSGEEYFLALEYIAGSDLRATMAALATRNRPMPVELALFVAREVANGLAYAHRRTDVGGAPLALVHCDISPPNLMLSFEGEVKIIDFGIARSRRRLTETNPDRGFGKFGYLAPEQLVKGFSVDHRTDVYALGVVLFEMLTGRHMFEVGKQPDYRLLARQVVKGEHPLPSEVIPALQPFDELVMGALKPNAAERYQTAAEFRDAIQRSLVAVSPTINPDHLADLLRDLLGDEVARRRGSSSLDKTDLERWQRQLTSQAGSTISFALAAGERAISTTEFKPVDRAAVAEPDGSPRLSASQQRSAAVLAAPGAARDRRARSPSDTAPDAEEAVPTVDQSVRFGSARRSTWSTRRALVSALVLVLAAGFGAGAWYLARNLFGGKRAPRAGQAAAPSTPSVGPTASLPGTVTAAAAATDPAPVPAAPAPVPAAGSAVQPVQAQSDIQVRELPPDEADAFDAPARDDKAGRGRRKQPERKRGRDASGSISAASPDAAAVQRRFHTAEAEYVAFKQRYGDRLEPGWQELSHLASYAQSAAGLLDLDRKIGLFRAQMRANQREKDRSIDPF